MLILKYLLKFTNNSLQEVIKAEELPDEENEIILNQDGSWNPVPKDEEAERLRKEKEAEEKKNEVLVDLSDDEDGEGKAAAKPAKEEPEDLGIPNVAVGTPPPTATGNPADIECIDLE